MSVAVARSERRWAIAGWIFGVVLPLLCFALDGVLQVLFAPGVPTDPGIGPMPLLGRAWRLPVVASVGLGVFAMGLWLWQRGRSRSFAWFAAPLLLYGFGVALTIGIVLIPFSVIGLLALIGLLGFIPFVTAIVFFYWWFRALEETRCLWIAGVVSIAVALGLSALAVTVQRWTLTAPRPEAATRVTVGPGRLEVEGGRVILVQPQGRRAFGMDGMEWPPEPRPEGAVGEPAVEGESVLRVFRDGTARLFIREKEAWRVMLGAPQSTEDRVIAATAGRQGWVVVIGEQAWRVVQRRTGPRPEEIEGVIEERARWPDVRAMTPTRWGLLVRTDTELRMCDGLRERWSRPSRGTTVVAEARGELLCLSDMLERCDGESGIVRSSEVLRRSMGRLRRACYNEWSDRLLLVYETDSMSLQEVSMDGQTMTRIDRADDIVVIDDMAVSLSGGVMTFHRLRPRR